MSADGQRRNAPPPSAARTDPRLEQLLAHPALWRAGSAARGAVWPSGFAPLDAGLPGGGWPRSGLIEILPMRFGQGELQLLLPALASITRRSEARWCIWVAPPLQPFAPALVAAGVALSRLLIVRAPMRGRRPTSLWAFEQALGSGACESRAGRSGVPRGCTGCTGGRTARRGRRSGANRSSVFGALTAPSAGHTHRPCRAR